MRRIGCHIWAGPDLPDLEHAARQGVASPEVWAPSDHPHLQAIASLWPTATLRTVGTTPPTVRRAFATHEHGDPRRLDLHTLDRPRFTVICPWTPEPSPSAQHRAARAS